MNFAPSLAEGQCEATGPSTEIEDPLRPLAPPGKFLELCKTDVFRSKFFFESSSDESPARAVLESYGVCQDRDSSLGTGLKIEVHKVGVGELFAG